MISFRMAGSDIDADRFEVCRRPTGRGLSNGSINRSISALRRMFNLATEDGKLRNVPHFPMLKEAAPRQGFFETRTIRDALPRACRTIYVCRWRSDSSRACGSARFLR